MKPIMNLLALLPIVFIGLTGCEKVPDDSEWISLFDGTSLKGWKVKCLPADSGKAFWKVEDGFIACNSIGRPDHDYVWLMSQQEFGDFELFLEFQTFQYSPGNSGVQVRSRYDTGPDAPNGGWMDGPQVDVHPPLPWRTGLIYDETREERRWIYPSLPDWNIDESFAPRKNAILNHEDVGDGWNELRITCKGTTIRTIMNGNVMADFDGSGILDNAAHKAHNVGLSGHIALQLHSNDELKIRFKDIRIRRLQDSS